MHMIKVPDFKYDDEANFMEIFVILLGAIEPLNGSTYQY